MSGKSIISNSYLEDIGDAIRWKKGSEDTYYPSQMGDAIRSIVGIVPAGTLDIDANGTYDVSEYAEADVNVPEPVTTSITVTEDGIYEAPTGVDGYDPVIVNTGIDAMRSEINSAVEVSGCDPLVEGLTALTRYANEVTGASDTTLSDAVESLVAGYGSSDFDSLIDNTITQVTNSSATLVYDYRFRGCIHLESIDFTIATSLGTRCFYECSSLLNANLPAVVSIGIEAFASCAKLNSFVAPLTETIAESGFVDCRSLTTLDFPNITSIGKSAFRRAYGLRSLIIRNPNDIVTLGANAFAGLTNFTVYVPDDLVDAYKQAENWIAVAGNIKGLSELPI